jgi:hypothetical protein
LRIGGSEKSTRWNGSSAGVVENFPPVDLIDRIRGESSQSEENFRINTVANSTSKVLVLFPRRRNANQEAKMDRIFERDWLREENS